jgi:hypothetical protein
MFNARQWKQNGRNASNITTGISIISESARSTTRDIVEAIDSQYLREPRFKIPEKFLPVAGTESSRNRNFDRNFDFVPVISGVFMCHR